LASLNRLQRPPTVVDEIVLDILGKGNGTTIVSDIDIPDHATFLDPAFMAKVKYEDDGDNFGDDNDETWQVCCRFTLNKISLFPRSTN
jgi:hypothetical protein